MRRSRLEDIFDLEKFKDQEIRQEFTSFTNRRDVRIRLIVVLIPYDNSFHYEVLVGGNEIERFSAFKDALEYFRNWL